ncbi:HNH endonuclease signature motif containing protein [Halalkalicoccus subterraneus]|uniref:HNH endonuclease signature motif containing protein n=1 Tax=Halalkalicoccus subterraneus TaxID=2675002 RepID=UPI000EFB4176|nr:HNH endonuclease signature motif containing protein [Halalkalicoccus subterraneus]
MEPEDKFGNEIYSNIYEELCEYGARLKQVGYQESRNKPNLFYYEKTPGIMFFMDMRGTQQVKIWEDTRPLFYWNIDLTMPDWGRRCLLKQERERLMSHQVPLRISFYAGMGSGFAEADNSKVPDPFGGPDGYCRTCGEDLSSNEMLCSEDCERDQHPNRFCESCNDRLEWDQLIRHHVSYYPEEIVNVCRSCHRKIHLEDSFHPELTPPQEDIERFYE